MSVKIGNQPAPVYQPDPQVTPGETLPDVSTMSLNDRLKLAKKAMEEKYGAVAIFKLPNDKRVFFRAPTEQEYQVYMDKGERIMWSNKHSKPTTAETLNDCRFQLAKACLITAADNSIIGNMSDLMKYPASIFIIAEKLETMAGSDITEDFLD